MTDRNPHRLQKKLQPKHMYARVAILEIFLIFENAMAYNYTLSSSVK